MDPISEALRPEAIPEIVIPWSGLYIPGIKLLFLDVAEEEAP